MSTILKYILMAIVGIVLAVLCLIVYRMFQFDAKAVRTYIDEEANKYKDKNTAKVLLTEGVYDILNNHLLTQQVLTMAKNTNTDREQLLVQAAIDQCIAFGYFPK